MKSNALTLLTGDRMTADAGMSAWLLMRLSGLDFLHRIVELERRDRPVLLVEDAEIATSLGIASFLGEIELSLWPKDNRMRAQAQSLAAEAFGGLPDFKRYLPMAITEQFMPAGRLLRSTARDLNHMTALWDHAQATNAGPFLFGDFSAVDAMFAPMAARCVTYGLELQTAHGNYVDAVMSYPLVAEWQALALDENQLAEQVFSGRSLPAPQNARVLVQPAISAASLPEPAPEPAPEPELAPEPAAAPVQQPAAPPAAKVAAEPPEAETEDELVLGEEALVPVREPDVPPFKVDVENEEEPVLIQPSPGANRLFPRAGKRLFQPNYRPARTDLATADADDRRAKADDKLSRSAAIKPIGGEIRRRR